MEKERKFKTIAIVSVLVAIVGLSIAFAALSRTLTINGQGKVTASNWNVVWQEINGEEFNGNGDTTSGFPKLDDVSIVKDNGNVEEGKNLNLGNISLKKPGDYVTYKINIKNKGDIDATLQSINVPDLSTMQVGQTNHTVDEFLTIEVLNETGSSSVTTPQNLAADAIIPVLVKVTFNDIGNELFSVIPSDGIEVTDFEITFTVNQASGNDLEVHDVVPGSNNQQSSTTYYNITFNDLSSIDWSPFQEEYMVLFEDRNGDMVDFLVGINDDDSFEVHVGFNATDDQGNIDFDKLYYYDIKENVWFKMSQDFSQKTNVSAPTINNVKFIDDSVYTKYGINKLSSEYQNLIFSKTVVQ